MKTLGLYNWCIYLYVIFISCNNSENVIIKPNILFVNTKPTNDSTLTPENYLLLKTSISNSKKHFSEIYKSDREKGNQQLKSYLFHTINDSLFPYWYGTPWDFNGTTHVPRQGLIACGYFVTTIIRDAGFDIKRVYLAQQAASVIIKELCKTETIQFCKNVNDLKLYLNKFENNSIFILGLDFHVGFIIKENDKLYFTHSNFMGNIMVEKQLIEESQPLIISRTLMIGNFLENDALLEEWVGD